MYFRTRSIAARALTTCILGLGIALANLESPQARGWTPTKHEALIRIGHDPDVLPAHKRYGGMVTALGSPDPQGRIYSFRANPLGIDSTRKAPNELTGWRLTLLSGERFASQFEVRGNTESEITITALDGPLNGLAVSDVFVIEDTPIVRPPASGEAPAGPSL